MKIADPAADLPRRECESQLTHGGRILTVSVWKYRKGEYLKQKPSSYAVEVGPGVVRLVKADGTVYEVTGRGCTCPDAEARGRERWCKHRTACAEWGLLGGTIATCEQGAYDDGYGRKQAEALDAEAYPRTTRPAPSEPGGGRR